MLYNNYILILGDMQCLKLIKADRYMKLAFSTLGCAMRNLDEIIGCAEKFGIGGVEVRGINGEMNVSDISCFSPDNAESSRNLLTKKHIALVCLGTSCSFHEKDKLDGALLEGRRAIDICYRMGIPAIRVFGNKIKSPEVLQETTECVGSSIDELCKYADAFGVSVFLEVHGDFNRTETLMPVVVKNEKHKNFGLIWDVMHSDRAYGDDWRVFYNIFRPYIKHIHIKDCIRAKNSGKPKLTIIGEGEIPLEEIIYTLESDGYSGWYSFEWEKFWTPELMDIEYALPGFIKLMKKFD
jgi:sugar phosphate isomerase/epimerase